MNSALPYVITISRQLGSGGAYLGQRLAARLNMLYVDHQIVCQAAQEMKVPEQDMVFRHEKVTSRWQLLLQTMGHTSDAVYAPPPIDTFTDKALYSTESEIITRIAGERSAVIVGRGGYYVLRNHPGCLHVFLHANMGFRQQRVQELYHVPPGEALKLINSIDRERAGYLRTLTGHDWLDARQYHLCLDTGAVGLEKTEELIITAFQARFSEITAAAKM
jgi:cytidylate kinase